MLNAFSSGNHVSLVQHTTGLLGTKPGFVFQVRPQSDICQQIFGKKSESKLTCHEKVSQ